MLFDENPKNECCYNANDFLAITIAPDDSLQYFNVQGRYAKFYEKYQHIFSKLPRTINYWFRIELSEPIGKTINTHGPRLHLHGIMHLKNKTSVFSFLCSVMPMLLKDAILSISHIKNIKQFDGCVGYMRIQEPYMPKQSEFTNFLDPDNFAILFQSQHNQMVADEVPVDVEDETSL